MVVIAWLRGRPPTDPGEESKDQGKEEGPDLIASRKTESGMEEHPETRLSHTSYWTQHQIAERTKHALRRGRLLGLGTDLPQVR